MKKQKSYKDLKRLQTFEERYEYLKMSGAVGVETFGFDRYINQVFYNSPEWKRARDIVIIRDDGCDLGDPNHPIKGKIIIHHMNPITEEDILNRNPDIFNPEYLICTSHNTHNAIHYSDEHLLPKPMIERTPGDTCPWK